MGIIKLLHTITHWEAWNYQVKYIPLTPVWLWYCLKARSMWFFTASNPTLTFGGFEGEPKREMYEQLPKGSYPESIYIEPGITFKLIEDQILQHGFIFPIAVKPDIGMMGYMFRKLSNIEELKLYHEKMLFRYIVQKLVEYPVEVSLFYYRLPNQNSGTISGLLVKKPPEIIGDGQSTFSQLLERNDTIKYLLSEMKARHQNRLNIVLQNGEKYMLSDAANRSQGGQLLVLEHEIDAKLLAFADEISNYSKHFYYGRFDIKCASLESLKNKEDFSILEYNGAGAGIQHIYGNHNSFPRACRIILQHWEKLFQISMINHRLGIPIWEYKRGKRFLKQARKDFRVLRKLDTEFPTF